MSRLGQINRIKHGLVFSKLFYCSNVWSNTSSTNLDQVQQVQNFSCRTELVERENTTTSRQPLNICDGFLPDNSYIIRRNAIMAFKCMTGCALTSLTDQFLKRFDVSKRSARNSQDLQIPLLKTATGQITFYYRTVKNWNALDPSLKLCKLVKQFKAK